MKFLSLQNPRPRVFSLEVIRNNLSRLSDSSGRAGGDGGRGINLFAGAR